MLKKVILSVLLSGLIGVLIWGGINRTLAKINNERNINDLYFSYDGIPATNGTQHFGKGDHKFSDEECNEEYYQVSANGQVDTRFEFGTSGISKSLTDTSGQGKLGGSGNRNGNGNCISQGGGANPLNMSEIDTLHMALNDEYHALSVYQSVIAIFGEVDPFVEISFSEQRHISALVNQFNKHGLSIPENH